jgi:hypothetical protein
MIPLEEMLLGKQKRENFHQWFDNPPPRPYGKVRLLNRTTIPSAPVQSALEFAAGVAGVDDVIVILRRRIIRRYCIGLKDPLKAHACLWPAEAKILRQLHVEPKTAAMRGHVVITVVDPSIMALGPETGERYGEWMVDTSIHEMVHIADYRNPAVGRASYWGDRDGKRRLPHNERPCEIAANGKVVEVRENYFLSGWRDELIAQIVNAFMQGGAQ